MAYLERLLALSHAWFQTYEEGTPLCYARRALTERQEEEPEGSG